MLFVYSRMAWDNTHLIWLSAAVFYFATECAKSSSRGRSAALAGAFAALGVSVHLMALPLAAAAFLTIAATRPVPRKALVFFALSFSTVSAPYVWYLSGATCGIRERFLFTSLPESLLETALGLAQWFSLYPLEYFLGDDSVDYLSPVPWLWNANYSWGISIGAFAVAVLAAREWAKKRMLRPEPKFALLLLALTFAFYAALGPFPYHPHYFQATAFIVPVLLGWGFSQLQKEVQRIAAFIFLLIASMNIIGVYFLGQDIARNEGTRSLHYGSSVGELEKAVRGACLILRNNHFSAAALDPSSTVVFSHPLRWLLSHSEGCAGLDIKVGPRDFSNNEISLKLKYANPNLKNDGRLMWEVVR
jgi:hypothetical protein